MVSSKNRYDIHTSVAHHLDKDDSHMAVNHMPKKYLFRQISFRRSILSSGLIRA